MEQTAVEFYSLEHRKLLINLENKEISLGEYAVSHIELLNQAKELEKQHIIDAFDEGNPNGFIDKDGEQYYNETFENI